MVDGRLVVVGRQEERDSSYLLLKHGVTRFKVVSCVASYLSASELELEA